MFRNYEYDMNFLLKDNPPEEIIIALKYLMKEENPGHQLHIDVNIYNFNINVNHLNLYSVKNFIMEIEILKEYAEYYNVNEVFRDVDIIRNYLKEKGIYYEFNA